MMTDNAQHGDKMDATQIISNEALDALAALDAEQAVNDNELIIEADDVTHVTKLLPHLSDDDGLLHIGTVRFRGNLILTDKETKTVYHIMNKDLDEAVIGRLNTKSGHRPQLDFTNAGGKERGVSRRHATLNQRGDLIFVTDHHSLNGTYLNGQRLVPEQARVMRDSDSLRIGHIILTVTFERITSDV